MRDPGREQRDDPGEAHRLCDEVGQVGPEADEAHLVGLRAGEGQPPVG